jgi:hypothetical protein
VFRTHFNRPASTARLLATMTTAGGSAAVVGLALHLPVIATLLLVWAGATTSSVAFGERSRRRFLVAERALPTATLRNPDG